MNAILRVLFISFLFGIQLVFVSSQANRIKLTDIKSLKLYKGAYTNGRRLPSILQLQCIEGKCSNNEPKVVNCYNRGTINYNYVKWECTALLPEGVEFGRLDVSCEGYASNSDPYVLVGSCGLRYTLKKEETVVYVIVSILVVLLIIGIAIGLKKRIFVFKFDSNSRTRRSYTRNRSKDSEKVRLFETATTSIR